MCRRERGGLPYQDEGERELRGYISVRQTRYEFLPERATSAENPTGSLHPSLL